MWNNIHFTAKRVEVADVCGAGDTFLSALAYCYLLENTMPIAINFAIRASAITVQHIGNYAPDLKEI
jgi:D-beta-D-heptose 7-phosphate kinase/D-beta-D-heptose 1-phosphate adenosyltransferase